MELDLNLEPLDQTHTSMIGFDSIWNELESANGHIEERIRHLEAVISRARQRQRWRRGHTPIQLTSFPGELIAADVQDEGRVHQDEVGFALEGRTVESGKRGKRKSTHLIAKALGMETETTEAECSTGNVFDCNICLDMARDPVLTCCGHLFCWPCFYQLSDAYANAKECPVCKGEVTETGIVPIYGNASVNSNCQLELKEAGLGVPARPHAHRIESIRQQLISRGESSSAVLDVRQFSNFVGVLGDQVQIESLNTATDRTTVLLAQSRRETENNQDISSHQFSRLLVQGAASFSSLSSALNSAVDSAERLVDDFESFIHSHLLGRSQQINARAVNRDSLFNIAATNQSESHTRDLAATGSAVAASVPPLSRNDDFPAVTDSEIQATDSSRQIISPDPSSSSSRRTDVLQGVSSERPEEV